MMWCGRVDVVVVVRWMILVVLLKSLLSSLNNSFD